MTSKEPPPFTVHDECGNPVATVRVVHRGQGSSEERPSSTPGEWSERIRERMRELDGKPTPVFVGTKVTPEQASRGDFYVGFDPASPEDSNSVVTFGRHVGGTVHWCEVITPINIDEKAAEAGVAREPGEEWADWAVRIGEALAEKQVKL